jgi:hypothetical protein
VKHAALKKAVFQANLENADVALRALDRIDKDEDFRDAIEAIVTANDDVNEKLRNLINSHFEPVQLAHKHGVTFREKPVMPPMSKLGVTMTGEELIQLINDQTLDVLMHLVSNDAIEKRVVRFVSDQLETILLTLLGLEKGFVPGIQASVGSPEQPGRKCNPRSCHQHGPACIRG